jgi:hypothetical protein
MKRSLLVLLALTLISCNKQSGGSRPSSSAAIAQNTASVPSDIGATTYGDPDEPTASGGTGIDANAMLGTQPPVFDVRNWITGLYDRLRFTISSHELKSISIAEIKLDYETSKGLTPAPAGSTHPALFDGDYTSHIQFPAEQSTVIEYDVNKNFVLNKVTLYLDNTSQFARINNMTIEAMIEGNWETIYIARNLRDSRADHLFSGYEPSEFVTKYRQCAQETHSLNSQGQCVPDVVFCSDLLGVFDNEDGVERCSVRREGVEVYCYPKTSAVDCSAMIAPVCNIYGMVQFTGQNFSVHFKDEFIRTEACERNDDLDPDFSSED